MANQRAVCTIDQNWNPTSDRHCQLSAVSQQSCAWVSETSNPTGVLCLGVRKTDIGKSQNKTSSAPKEQTCGNTISLTHTFQDHIFETQTKTKKTNLNQFNVKCFKHVSNHTVCPKVSTTWRSHMSHFLSLAPRDSARLDLVKVTT